MKKLLLPILVALSVSTSAHAATGLTSVTGTSVWPNADNQDHSLGWAFTTSGLTISALGYNDHGFSRAHNVGLYNSSGSLLASVSVNGGATLLNGYRYTNLGSNLAIGAGTYYLVGTTQGQNDGWIYQSTSFTTAPGVTYAGSFYTSGTGGTLAFPGNPAADRQYLLTNFIGANGAVPEPATWAMLIAGFGLVGGAMRRRQSVRVTYA